MERPSVCAVPTIALPDDEIRAIELNAEKVGMQFCVAFFTGPEVERNGSDFVNNGNGVSAF
jgi:hypothetical protein